MIVKRIFIKDILTFLGDQVLGVDGIKKNDADSLYIDNLADVEHVNETTLDWVNPNKENKQEIAEASKAKVLVVDSTVVYTPDLEQQGKTLLVVKAPRTAVAKIAEHFFLDKPSSCIHPSAIIDEEAVVDPTAHIGAGCVIGKASIGANTILMPNVVVYDDVTIGDNCLIQAGAIIGTDGLGCTRDEEGKLTKFPHLGGIRIGNNVEIGANCQIAKGTFSDTIIEDGCKMNGLCFIAHNSHLEENVWITGDTMLCGSVHVEKNVTIFSNVIVRDQIRLGEGSIIGMGSVVTKPIPAHETWLGAPARKIEKK